MNDRTKLQEADEGLRMLVATLREMQGQFSLSQLVALLTIHLAPGSSINELAHLAKMTQQSASRNVGVLLGRYEHQEKRISNPLVEQKIKLNDPRQRSLHLTSTGSEVADRIRKCFQQ